MHGELDKDFEVVTIQPAFAHALKKKVRDVRDEIIANGNRIISQEIIGGSPITYVVWYTYGGDSNDECVAEPAAKQTAKPKPRSRKK